MATKKDMRREDLIVPYREPAAKESPDLGGTMGSTLPMAAMFMRNKYIGWAALVYSVQAWLSESPEQRKNASMPGYFSVGMSFMALLVTYMPLFMPPPIARGAGAQPAAVPGA